MHRLFLLLVAVLATSTELYSQPVVRWDSPSENAAGSMPLGNGQVAVNLWATGDGTLSLYVARIDALSEIGRLLKLGRVDIQLTPNPFASGQAFSQTLTTRNGMVEISTPEATLRIFVDAESPVIYVEGSSKTPLTVNARANIWRNTPRTISRDSKESHSLWSMQGVPDTMYTLTESADVVCDRFDDAIAWYHRNESSVYDFSLAFQQLDLPPSDRKDPYIDRTFGLYVSGDNFEKTGPTTLRSDDPMRRFTLKVVAPSLQCSSAGAWEDLSAQIYDDSPSTSAAAKRTARHWNRFWDRSHIVVSTPADDDSTGRLVTEAYGLQRWMTACAGRGEYALKFNGTLFTVDPVLVDASYDFGPDFRLWGECYWWQNTRLMYHTMLRAGDTDMMPVLFDHYYRNMAMFRQISQDFYGAKGAIVPETSTIFGTFGNRDYGWDRDTLQRGDVQNHYIRNMWNASLELTDMMLDYYEYTGDAEFVRERLVPMAYDFMLYFQSRFAVDAEGILQITPSQSLETYQKGVTGDLPNIAGLRACLPRLLALPESMTTPEQRKLWNDLLQSVPPMPTQIISTPEGEKKVFAPAEKFTNERQNVENPRLYSIFPFRLSNITSADRQIAIDTYLSRIVKGVGGWTQDGQQAAILGLTDEAARLLKIKVRDNHKAFRFPVNWGPNYDWTPDQDHGSNIMITLQEMIMQSYDGTIYLLPAFPKDWNVDFKLSTPAGNSIRGIYQDQKWVKAPKLQHNSGQKIVM